MDNSHLSIYLGDKEIGHLWLEGRIFCFAYTCRDTAPISISLPVREEPYTNDESRPFFVNLLPEGLAREAIARQLHISNSNDFDLLKALGEDCAGAVRIFPSEATHDRTESYDELTQEQLVDLIVNLKVEPLGARKMRLSLAGAQTKIPVRIANGTFSLPVGGAPSTHIIKIASSHFPDTVENETFVMMLAMAVGLNVPKVQQLKFGEITAFVIERYDRRNRTDGTIGRLLQEDFCQARGLEPEYKYQETGGLNLVDCFEIIDNASVDIFNDRGQLLEWVAFNIAVGNADAHAKNLSLLYTHEGIRLAPFYDLLSTSVYGSSHDERFAMTIGRQWDSLKVSEEDWGLLAQDIRVKKTALLRTVKGMYGRVAKKLEPVFKEYEATYPKNSTVCKISETILARLKILM
ncbi:MAG: type II toxin-antitoxin system HipA family toxin [Geobacter sp.]|nr:MAG: type II toxin-antitoxin system HipA family toxin [Geobacter sp.]